MCERLDRAETWGPQGACSQPGQVYFIFMMVILQKDVHICMSVCVNQWCSGKGQHAVCRMQVCVYFLCVCSSESSHTVCLTRLDLL